MFRDLLVPSHIIVIALVIFIVFGWKKMPDMARSLGRSARILKSEVDEYKAESIERSGTKSPATETSEQVVEETHVSPQYGTFETTESSTKTTTPTT